MNLCVERGQRGVRLIERTRIAVKFELAAAGKFGGNDDGKFRIHGNVASGDSYMVVGIAFLRTCCADDDFAVFQFEFLDGEFRSGGRRLRRRIRGRWLR